LVNTRRLLISYGPPTLLTKLLTEIVDTLNGDSPDQLQHVTRYIVELADHKACEGCLDEEPNREEIEERPDDLLADVPSKVRVTIKAINDNRYYYWQWWEGNTVTSRYKFPVNLDE
jgi:hypothetical protein